jgi:hypothetical protein
LPNIEISKNESALMIGKRTLEDFVKSKESLRNTYMQVALNQPAFALPEKIFKYFQIRSN